jgi:hypothetical protein
MRNTLGTALPSASETCELKQFQVVVDQVASQQVLGFRKNRLQRMLEMRGIIREANDANLGTLPSILVVELGDGHVEPRSQTVFQAAQDLAFVLKGMSIRDIDFQGQQTDRHDTQLSCGQDNASLRRDPSLALLAQDDIPLQT